MLLSTILTEYKPVYPQSQDWKDTFALFQESPADMAVINDLIDDYKKTGKFREPVILSTYDEDYDEEEDYYEPYVKNGTHRVYAHYLMGEEEVTVQHGWQEPTHEDIDDETYSLYPQTITVMKFTEPPSDTLHDTLTDWFRSFRVNSHYWVTADLHASSGNHYTIYWTGVELDEQKLEHLNTLLMKRLKELHITPTTVKTVTVFTEHEENMLL